MSTQYISYSSRGSGGGGISIGLPANGLSITSGVLSLGLSSTSTTGALSSTDWNQFNSGVTTQTVVTGGGTAILTPGSQRFVFVNGSGAVQLPSTSTMALGTDWWIMNQNSTALNIKDSTGAGTWAVGPWQLGLLSSASTSLEIWNHNFQLPLVDYYGSGVYFNAGGGNNQLNGVADPTSSQQAATKNYCDTTGRPYPLSPTDITNKYVTLNRVPNNPAATILQVVGGIAQGYGPDFIVSGNQLSWSGLFLDGVLTAGDQLLVQIY